MKPEPLRTAPGVAISAILALAAIGCTALVKGYNGTLMLLVVAAIAGIAGFTARDIAETLIRARAREGEKK